MRNWLVNNRETLLKSVYAIPICFAIVISVFHCIAWFNIANPTPFAIAMSIGIEVAAATTLVAIMTGKITFSIILTFGIITIYQMLGNIFFSFNFIDEDGELFRTWVQFMTIILGEENTWTMERHKFWLSVLSGVIVPGLSLLSLHLIATFEFKDDKTLLKEEQPLLKKTNNETVENVVENNIEVKKELPVADDKKIVFPTEISIEPVEEEIKTEKPKQQKSKLVLGNQTGNFVKSHNPAIVEQISTKDATRKIKLPGFKKG